MRNDEASSVVTAVFILIIIAVISVSFIFLVSEFKSNYSSANADPVNNTGILGFNTTAYRIANESSTAVAENLPVGILLSLLLFAIMMAMLILAILKR
jgi:hypothetical protein